MIKIFVVDDEDIIRTGIRNSIERLNSDYYVCGEADNGEIALPLIQELKPDILLVDIEMPFMDGLELAAIVKKSLPWMRIAVISGHDEFAYAQQALNIGVDSYLLKPVNSHKLMKLLQDLTEHMEKDKQNLLYMSEKQKHQELEKILSAEHLLSRMVVGAASVDSISQFASQHHLTLLAARYIVCSAHLDGLHEEKLNNCRLLCKKLFDTRKDVLSFFKGVDNLVLIITGNTEDDLRETAFEIAHQLRHELERLLFIDAVIGVGSIVTHITQIPASYKIAHSIFVRGIMNPEIKIILAADLPETAAAFQPEVTLDMDLQGRLRYATKKDLAHIIDLHFGMENNISADSILFRYYQLTDLVVTVKRLLHEFNIDVDIDIDIDQPQNLLNIANSWDELHHVSMNMLTKFIKLRDNQGGHTNHSHVLCACEIINENYHDVTISLHTVAAEIGFSPNYFSALFSQQTGQTFIDYLTNRRIAVAKELLGDKQNRLHDIAERVGYNDSHYFSYVFKKTCGISPREYRNSLAED